MKKTINENTLKSIIKESLKNYLKESMDSELGMREKADGWTPEMDDMWDEFGNNNVHDTDGAFGVLAQGDDDDHVSRVAKSLRSTKFDTDANMGEFEDEADEFASDDNAEYLRDKMFESVVRKSVNETFNKNTNTGKTVKLTESELKNIISEAVMKVLNESIEEGGFGNFMRRTFNSSSVNANANYVDRVYQNYLKKFNQIKGHLEPGQINIIQRNLKTIQDLAARARNGEKIGEQQVGYYTKTLDRWLGQGNNQRDAYMAKQNAPSQSQPYNNSRMDSYDTSDGISHFGNGDAYRA